MVTQPSIDGIQTLQCPPFVKKSNWNNFAAAVASMEITQQCRKNKIGKKITKPLNSAQYRYEC